MTPNQAVLEKLRESHEPLMEAISSLRGVCFMGLMGCLDLLQQDKEYPVLAIYLAADKTTREMIENPPKNVSPLIQQRALAIGWYDIATQVRNELAHLPKSQPIEDVMQIILDVQDVFTWVKERFEP